MNNLLSIEYDVFRNIDSTYDKYNAQPSVLKESVLDTPNLKRSQEMDQTNFRKFRRSKHDTATRQNCNRRLSFNDEDKQ